MTYQKDDEYRDRVHHAMMEAIFTASIADGVALMKTGEIVDACVSIIAMLSAGSDMTASPTKRREFADMVAKKLLKRIVACQEHVAENGWPENFHNLNEKDYQ